MYQNNKSHVWASEYLKLSYIDKEAPNSITIKNKVYSLDDGFSKIENISGDIIADKYKLLFKQDFWISD